jgi:recombination protein RecT
MAESKELAPIERMKNVLYSPSVQAQFKNALAENSSLFVASLIDVYASDKNLQACEPRLVVMEALKAATLDLPINRQLGFAYIIPYKKKQQINGKWESVSIPQFQPGYKAFIQLAMRTGQYRFINADLVYEGEVVSNNRITGELSISGEPSGACAIGYFAFFQTINGFQKAIYWTREKIEAHAKRHSKTFAVDNSAWKTDFDAMALKTVLKALLSKYGILSVKIVSALASDDDQDERAEQEAEAEITEKANQTVIDVKLIEPAVRPDPNEPLDASIPPKFNPNPPAQETMAARGPDF